MLGVAAAVVGAVCAFERRSTGGVLAPMLTHFFWGTGHGAGTATGVRRLAQRIRQLVLTHPGRVYGDRREQHGCDAGHQENRLH